MGVDMHEVQQQPAYRLLGSHKAMRMVVQCSVIALSVAQRVQGKRRVSRCSRNLPSGVVQPYHSGHWIAKFIPTASSYGQWLPRCSPVP